MQIYSKHLHMKMHMCPHTHLACTYILYILHKSYILYIVGHAALGLIPSCFGVSLQAEMMIFFLFFCGDSASSVCDSFLSAH